MSFLDRMFAHFADAPGRAVVHEVHGKELRTFDGATLATEIARARGFLASRGVRSGDRVAICAANSARWIAADLAAIASGAIVVPLYDKQAPAELATMLRSARPSLLVAGTPALAASIEEAWPEHGPIALLDDVFASAPTEAPRHAVAPEDPVAIIYTSGTSGLPKGVVLTRANVDFMIPKTIERLATVTGGTDRADRVFHFLPFCFAASRLMMWTQLSRPNPLHLSTDLTNLVEEMGTAKPEYFLNVPAVLERIRAGVGKKIDERGGIAAALYRRGLSAKRTNGSAALVDRLALAVAERVVFPRIRAQIGENLRFLVSGSAPLAEDTQRWFEAIGIPIYQAYGLTETTGIVSIDLPDRVEPGRVGVVLDGVETKIDDEGEFCVRGPNVFGGYWELPSETAKVLDGEGWFHTGDQVDVERGNLKIVGRIKNLIVPESGHNIAPEPLEEKLLAACPSIAQCMIVGHARPFVAVLVPNAADRAALDEAIAALERAHFAPGGAAAPADLSAVAGHWVGKATAR